MGGAELPELVYLSFNGDIRRWLLRWGERVMAPLRPEMMARVFSEIEAHIGGRLRKLRATYQEDAVRFYGPERRRVWPSLTYFIAQCGEYTIALHIEVEWKLYHGLIFFRGDFQQGPRESDWWLWYKYLTEESPINFRDCDGRYPELFDPKRHQAIMEEIFAQMDHDIELAQKTGVFE